LENEKEILERQKNEMQIQQAHLNTLLDQKKALSEDYEVQLAKARQEAATYKAKIKEVHLGDFVKRIISVCPDEYRVVFERFYDRYLNFGKLDKY
jgi:hypothetical protein